MAKVLQFALSASAERRPRPDAPAEIVIFPGVRVEYHDAPPPPAGRTGGRGRRRSAGKRALTA